MNAFKLRGRKLEVVTKYVVLALVVISFLLMVHKTKRVVPYPGSDELQNTPHLGAFIQQENLKPATPAATSNLKRGKENKRLTESLLLPTNVRGRLLKITLPNKTNERPVNVLGLGFTYKLTTSMGVTDPHKSVYYILKKNGKSEINKGSFITLRIEARDHINRLKTAGGDFWYVTMFSLNQQKTSTSGRVVDHRNGTYSAYLYAGWSGKAVINVTLVHSSEAVDQLKRRYIDVPGKRKFWAQFHKGIDYEISSCVLQRGGIWTNMCEYFNRNSLINTRLLCEKPLTLPCDSIMSLRRQPPPILDPSTSKWLHRNYSYQRLKNGPINIKIEDPYNDTLRSSLKCGPNLPPVKSDGYWFKNHWNSLACNFTYRPFNAYEDCLRNTDIYFLGDLIVRKMALISLEVFSITTEIPNEKFSYFSFQHPKYNTNVTFRQHIYNIIPEATSILQERFEADVVTYLPKTRCNYIILIGPWTLFGSWDPESYREYLEYLRLAIDQLQQRCPGAKVILRGPQPWKEETTLDYYYWSMQAIQKDVFKGSGVYLVDVYDMILAAHWQQTLQVPSDIIRVQLNLMLNYVCF